MDYNKFVSRDKIKPTKFYAVVEISKGSKNKYELDKDTMMLRLDRILFTSTHYPQNYGFIPHTLASDNDPLDVLILSSESILPMTLVECKPIGVVRMYDKGMADEKIIAVCTSDPFYNHIEDISKLPAHLLDEIKHFFTVYKELEGVETFVSDIEDKNGAESTIENCILRHEKEELNR